MRRLTLKKKFSWCLKDLIWSKKEYRVRQRVKEGDEGKKGGQGPSHSATGKTAINNLHHLSLCAPLDHSTNSARNLRQKHTLTHMRGWVPHEHTKGNMHVCRKLREHTHIRARNLTEQMLNFPLKARQQRSNSSSVAQPGPLSVCLGESLQEACFSWPLPFVSEQTYSIYAVYGMSPRARTRQ